MVAGIAGINPNRGTLADVTFAKYAVQVALQYEFDAREIPSKLLKNCSILSFETVELAV